MILIVLNTFFKTKRFLRDFDWKNHLKRFSKTELKWRWKEEAFSVTMRKFQKTFHNDGTFFRRWWKMWKMPEDRENYMNNLKESLN